MSDPKSNDMPSAIEGVKAAHSYMPEAVGHSLPASKLAESVAKNVVRAGFPEVNETLIAVETERAISQIRGGTSLPIDGDASKGDAFFLSDVAERKERMGQLQLLLAATEEKISEARRVLAQLMPPLSVRQWATLIGALFIITVFGVLTLKALLASSFDEQLFRPYFAGLNVADPEMVSAQHAEVLVILAASFLLGGKALAVVGSSGRLTAVLKLLLFAVALIFSGALAAARLSDGWSLAAVAVSFVELAVLVSYTLLLVAVGSVLKASSERGIAYRAGLGTVAVEEERQAFLRRELDVASREFETRRLALAQREDDCRRLPLYEALARATVEAEYLVATAELITKEVTSVHGIVPAVPPAAEEQKGGAQ